MGKHVQEMEVIPENFSLLIWHKTQKIMKVYEEDVMKACPNSATV